MRSSKTTVRKARYSVDLEAGEVIPRGRAIGIHAGVAVAPEAWGGVSIPGQRVNVTRRRGDRDAQIDTSQLPVGAHTLRIDELALSRSGERAPSTEIPFIVVDTAAPLSRSVVARHAVRLRFSDLGVERIPMTGVCEKGMVEVFKAEDRKSQRPVELAFDSNGKTVDLDRMYAGLARRRLKKYGKLHPDLHALLESEKAPAKVPVAVWMRMPDTELPEKPDRGRPRRAPDADQQQIEASRAVAERFAASASKYGLKVERVDRAAPVVFGVVAADRVAELAGSSQVSAIFLHRKGGIADLGNSIAIANSDDAHSAGFNGKGVNVAVYENGPDDETNLNVVARFDSSPTTEAHARLTHAVIQNVEPSKPHGHAPNCNLHSANSMDLDALSWAADENCTVISQSFHRDAEQTSSGLSFDDVFKDHLALHWPYPTICEAAGNGVDTEFVNHKGFNRLTVGSHNDSASAMASDSVFRNPSSSHGDRELPEIAANGVGVSAVGLTMSGTSFAAPATAGAVAVVQEANSTLTIWPEGCRAIMMAAAWRNPAGSTWHADLVAGVDGADGAGAIDTRSATLIARSRQSRNNNPARRGFDVGTIVSGDVDGDGFMTYVYRIAVPRFLLSPTVKVALAWDSKVTEFKFFGITIPLSSTLTVDLDVHVRDSSGSTVASSQSWDNSYEIAEFAARRGETYEIRIRRWSGSDNVWFGIAWEVRGIDFFVDLSNKLGQLALGDR